MKKFLDRVKKDRRLFIIPAIIAAFVLGYILKPAPPLSHRDCSPSQNIETEAKVKIWTCAMHPQIKLAKSGPCPICFMDLVPVEEEEANEEHPRRLTMSEAARALAEIQTAPVVRKNVIKTIRMVGKVDYDETRLAHITAWVPGRLDRLYVDYTGIFVEKGARLVDLYSPDLVSTQEELLQAMETERRLKETTLQGALERATSTREATEERLRLWGLGLEQIEEIKRRGETVDHITMHAPVGGVVIQKHGFEGMYVNTGTRLYTIADLSQVWVILEAYESDMVWVHYGQEVEFAPEAYPGELFKGRITFINPFLNEQTRTVKLRVNVPNTDGRLKPGMFVRAGVKVRMPVGGKVMAPVLTDKWICPMHPEVISAQPGQCHLCRMALVITASLDYLNSEEKSEMPLVIPSSAPLITGRRAVVYVEVPNTDRPTYEGRVIKLGPRADEYYLVKSGLREGEKVVVQGNFKIDSALQIRARPSMMSPEDAEPLEHRPHHH